MHGVLDILYRDLVFFKCKAIHLSIEAFHS